METSTPTTPNEEEEYNGVGSGPSTPSKSSPRNQGPRGAWKFDELDIEETQKDSPMFKDKIKRIEEVYPSSTFIANTV
jgi:hypothetical protein